MRELWEAAAARAITYRASLAERAVAPSPEARQALTGLGGALPAELEDPATVLALLDERGSPATVASAGGRYFGFVTGSSLPVTVAAQWLAAAWDQNAAFEVGSPVSAYLETVALGWLVDVLRLPVSCGGAFVTGATMANVTALAAARHAVLASVGWQVEEQGLFGAPEVTVVVGEEVHISLLKALSLLGFGRARVQRVPTDAQGRMRADALPVLDAPAIVCIQAGNVNSGACDPAVAICAAAHQAGAWVHVDGAFGLWAAAAPGRRHLVSGVELADSWCTDAHKWLNVPYDSGLAFVREPEHLRAAMAATAAYLHTGDARDPALYTPELSRRARGIEVWAALRTLGREGLADLIERTCTLAGRFADGLRGAGYRVLNEVDLNQVLVSFGDAATTRAVIAAVQEDGTCWCGGTIWHGEAAMRISVSSAATTEDDVACSLAAIRRRAGEVRAASGRPQ